MNTSQRILNECEALLDKGFSIIPVSPDKKSIAKWKDYQANAPTMDDVKEWVETYKSMGIGIVTGSVSSVIVIDIDIKGRKPKTSELFDAGLPITEELIMNTTVARTGGGGAHVYLRYSDSDIRNRAGIIQGNGWSVDIRGEGGYVVAPPSMHESGTVYSWIRNNVMTTLPMDMQYFLQEHTSKPNKEKFDLGNQIPKGRKHEYLVSLAGTMMRSARFSEDELYAALITTLAIRQSPDDSDIVPNENIRVIAHDVWTRVNQGQWRGAEVEEPPKTYQFISHEKLWAEISSPMLIGKKIGVVGLDDIGGLAPGFYTLAARPGAGKSTYLAQVTNALLENKLKTMVVSCELTPKMFFGWMVSAVDGVPYDDDMVIPDRWKTVFMDRNLMVLDKMGRLNANTIKEMIIEHKPDVFVLDHLSKLFYPGKDAQRSKELEVAIEELQEAAVKNGTTILAAAHLNRNQEYQGAGGRPKFSDLRESGGIENSSDIVIFMYPPKGAIMSSDQVHIYFDCAKNRLFGKLYRIDMTFERKLRRFTTRFDTAKP